MKKRMLALAIVFLILSSHAALAGGEPLALTDMAGRMVNLPGPAGRIVALQAADCEILYAIGAGESLVGRGEYCNYPEEVLAVPSVQSGFETNLEQIIALDPDAVVMAKMGQREEDAKKLEEAGIAVVVSDAQTIEGVYSAIVMLGSLTGHEDEASQLVEGMQEAFSGILEASEGFSGGSVYFEVSPLEYGLWTAGTGTFMDEIAKMLRLENIFSDLEGWQGVSEEQVIARDPDHIVTTAMYFGTGLTPVEEVLSRASWSGMKAVSGGKVFNADADAITRPGPRLVQAAQDLFDFVYGE